ncbi:MAG TPA: ribose 5-phosphate isomerase B [Bacteroidetes bacterium]|nr:ribose 5-phosphate isomerase B [Bacteroidota bacterium]
MVAEIIIASDHAGVELKSKIKEVYGSDNRNFTDLGPFDTTSVDYPDYAHPLAVQVSQKASLGILICGSGNGVCMTANKYNNIRAALCWEVSLAELAKQHNNANVLCLPARFITEEKALDIVKAFLNTDFEGGRHGRRVDKIAHKQ